MRIVTQKMHEQIWSASCDFLTFIGVRTGSLFWASSEDSIQVLQIEMTVLLVFSDIQEDPRVRYQQPTSTSPVEGLSHALF